MIYLADFSVIKPDLGLLLWSTIFFFLFWGIIGKFAFRPIKDALKNRENDIQTALDSAEDAKRQVSEMKSKNDNMLKEAQAERMTMMREAKETKDRIVAEAKTQAKEEANNIIANAKMEIETVKQQALTEVKNTVGQMAISIAEKLVQKDLAGTTENVEFVNKLVKNINNN